MPAMTLNDGTMWAPSDEQVAKWKTLYPAVDVDQELNAMVGWLDANPTRRKTKRGISRFCNTWLSKAQDKGGSPMVRDRAPQGDKITRSRDMTSLDELTHNFTGDPAMRQYFIEKHGQCFENGVRYTKQ